MLIETNRTGFSLQSLTIDELIEMAHHPISSRVLDMVLSSSTVPAKLKRKFVLGFMGRWHELVDDRIGSRVGERCWAAADGYMKVRSPFLLANLMVCRMY